MANIKELQKDLTHITSIAGKFTSMPILSNVLIEASGGLLTLTASDLEVTFQCSIEADVLEEGAITVPAKPFADIIGSLKGATLTLEERENLVLRVKTDYYHSDLLGISPTEFPKTMDTGAVTFTEFPGAALVDSINKTIYSVAGGNTNYNLAGIFWVKEQVGDHEALKLVSTDNSRLNIATLAEENLGGLLLDEGVLVSRKGLSELKSLAEDSLAVSLGVDAKNLVARTGNTLLVMRLLNGKFPNYHVLIPDEAGHPIVVKREDFSDSLKRVSKIFDDKVRVVYLRIGEDSLTLSGKNSKVGESEESLTVSHSGPELSFGFDPRHLLDAISTMKSKELRINIIDNKRPAVLSGDQDPGYLGILTIMAPAEEE